MGRIDILQPLARAPRVLRFVLVGGVNTAFSYGIYAGGLALGLPFYAASAIALVGGILFSFVTQGKLVFTTSLNGRFGVFVLVWALIYAVNVATIWGLTQLGPDAYLAGLLAIGPTAVLSYVLQRYVVFGGTA